MPCDDHGRNACRRFNEMLSKDKFIAPTVITFFRLVNHQFVNPSSQIRMRHVSTGNKTRNMYLLFYVTMQWAHKHYITKCRIFFGPTENRALSCFAMFTKVLNCRVPAQPVLRLQDANGCNNIAADPKIMTFLGRNRQ